MLFTDPGGKTASGPINPLETWWLDLIDPTDEEKDAAESICRFTIPSRQELSSIETSSRISEDDGILYLSMPIISSAANVDELLPPRLRAFQGLSRHRPLYGIALVRCRGNKVFQAEAPKTGVETFTALADEMVDLSADTLEAIGGELDATRDPYSQNATRNGNGW